MFTLNKSCTSTSARAGVLQTSHGLVKGIISPPTTGEVWSDWAPAACSGAGIAGSIVLNRYPPCNEIVKRNWLLCLTKGNLCLTKSLLFNEMLATGDFV